MSFCDSCKSPGACCKEFVLTDEDGIAFSFRMDLPILGQVRGYTPEDEAEMRPIPFRPILKKKDRKRTWADLTFACSNLGADGRCKDYEHRPQLCRDYESGSGGLCVYNLRTKTIPLSTAATTSGEVYRFRSVTNRA